MKKQNLSVALLATQDSMGAGGFSASQRLHQAYLDNNSIHSQMYVARKLSDLHTIVGPQTRLQSVINDTKSRLGAQLMRLQRSPNPTLHSPELWSASGLMRLLKSSRADVFHLHWICGEFLSVENIGKLTKPLVWTLHDMWPFSGAEHYSDDSPTARWRIGYYADNRPLGHKGLDIDRWVWNRKRRAWRTPIHIVTPSQWLADCASKSALMSDWPLSVIPYCLDVERFRPWPKIMARQLFNLPLDKKIVLFGAVGGSKDPRKGWDLLQPALAKLTTQMTDLMGVVFGQSEPQNPPRLGLPLRWMGKLYDEITLALLYSAADVMVVPSRQDNLPQTGTEAQTCGCPVVAFNTCGLPSVLVHQETGYLATPFEVEDLARGIAWILTDPNHHAQLSQKARERAIRLWSPEVVVKQYIDIYSQVMASYSC